MQQGESGRYPPPERRSDPRVQDAVGLALPAAEEPLRGSDEPTHKVSLSASGIAVAADVLLRPGERTAIIVTLFPARFWFRAVVEVVSANDAPEIADGDKPTYRLRFIDLSDEVRAHLTEHVQRLIEGRPMNKESGS